MRSHGAAWLVSLLAIVGIVASCASDDSPEENTGTSGGIDGGAPPTGDGGSGVDGGGGNDSATKIDGAAGVKIPTVSAGAFRITPTEITQKQYKAFLDEVSGKTVDQASVCSWNTTFAPAAGADCVLDASATPNRPVRCVDWCDARAYCEWAGLRLCGKISGGPNPIGSHADPGSSQWHAACGGTANTAYPYGGSFNPSSCTFGLGQSGPPTDVGTMSTCEGGYPGVFDMLGNVGEWEDSCDGTAGQTDKCRIRGGYYSDQATNDQIDCAKGESYVRTERSAKFGIRCCSK